MRLCQTSSSPAKAKSCRDSLARHRSSLGRRIDYPIERGGQGREVDREDFPNHVEVHLVVTVDKMMTQSN